MTNDYKPDEGKPPVRSAVLIPFRHALLALARMMRGQVERHKLGGAADPFQEWAKLPDAEKRLHEAGARHALCPDLEVNPDSGESHELHDLWNILAVVELQERKKLTPSKPTGYARLHAAALRLYVSGRWDCSAMPNEGAAALWAGLRDALGLAPGTATAAGVAGHTGEFPRDYNAPDPGSFGAERCICGHPKSSHMGQATGLRGRCQAFTAKFVPRGYDEREECNCPEFREE